MKKFLPKTINNPQGFTLVELMVVIAIIAILSIVGLSMYGNTQKAARDSVRRTEIAVLAKSIEAARDPLTSNYTYNSTTYGNDYGTTKPKDPSNGTPAYSVAFGSTVPAVPTAWATTAASPTAPAGYAIFVDNAGAFTTAITAQKYWRICALLEAGTAPNVYCVVSQNP